jgi:hypothetical protein
MSLVVAGFFVLAGILLSGCAGLSSSRYKAVPVASTKEPTRICRTVRPKDDAEICKEHKYCDRNPEMTCAEAYYRLTHCARAGNERDNHRWLDGGIALRKDDEPNRRGQPNGIPCEDRCGDTALKMKIAIAAQPFFPPTTTTKGCN